MILSKPTNFRHSIIQFSCSHILLDSINFIGTTLGGMNFHERGKFSDFHTNIDHLSVLSNQFFASDLKVRLSGITFASVQIHEIAKISTRKSTTKPTKVPIKHNRKMAESKILSLQPLEFAHIEDMLTNITHVERGPCVIKLLEHQHIVFGPAPYVIIPPGKSYRFRTLSYSGTNF